MVGYGSSAILAGSMSELQEFCVQWLPSCVGNTTAEGHLVTARVIQIHLNYPTATWESEALPFNIARSRSSRRLIVEFQ